MKFILFFLPALPASIEERERLRPIAHRTDKWQQMFDEVIELARLAEDVGFEGISFPEHYLHTEGMEMGGPTSWYLHVAHHTRHIKIGPVGYVLPAWNPLRLAAEVAWLDQMTRGRTFVGMARGYQTRWFHAFSQHMGIQTATSDASERDRMNRRLFEEAYEVLKLAWKDEAFSFKGEFYQFPYPYEGCDWTAHPYTRRFGAPGELGPDNKVHKISVVPKPYQKPHPPLFQAFSASESTIRWCARQDIIPVMLTSWPAAHRAMVEAYREEAAQHGRHLPLGQGTAVLRQINLGANKEEALTQAQQGIAGSGWQSFWGYHGFYETFRKPGETGDVPWTLERMEEAHYLYAGDVDWVRRRMHELRENAHPEYFVWWIDQGLLPLSVVRRNLELFGTKILPELRD